MTPENVEFVLYSNASFHRFEQTHRGVAAVLKNKVSKDLREIKEANGDQFQVEFWWKASDPLKRCDFDRFTALPRAQAMPKVFALWNRIRKDAAYLAGKSLGTVTPLEEAMEVLSRKFGEAQ
jgi:hypothetical protein